jgi:predicted nucleotidyltransferase
MINIYKPKLTNLQQAILRLLFVKTGESLNQRAISKILNVSAPAVMKALPYLEKNELIILKQDKESKRWSIELNRDNRKVMQLKRADNMKLIYESGLADFLEKEFAGGVIILFGSYSKGEDTIKSDIDIAIIERKDKELDLSKFEKDLERKIHLLFFDSFKKINENLRNNILNGIVFAGSVEL